MKIYHQPRLYEGQWLRYYEAIAVEFTGSAHLIIFNHEAPRILVVTGQDLVRDESYRWIVRRAATNTEVHISLADIGEFDWIRDDPLTFLMEQTL